MSLRISLLCLFVALHAFFVNALDTWTEIEALQGDDSNTCGDMMDNYLVSLPYTVMLTLILPTMILRGFSFFIAVCELLHPEYEHSDHSCNQYIR